MRRHEFGDYDEDDYAPDPSHSDGDNDDNERPFDGDGDSDGSPKDYYDGDDSVVRQFGHTAPAAQEREIASLVDRYYAAAVVVDGTKACSLLAAPLAKNLPESLGGDGPFYLRGAKTCAAVLVRLFSENRHQLDAYATTLKVTGVRVLGKLGLVLLGFKALPARQIEVLREHGVWRMYAPLDNELP